MLNIFSEQDLLSAWQRKLEDVRLSLEKRSKTSACSYINRTFHINQASLNKIAQNHCISERRSSLRRCVPKFNYSIYRFLTS